MIICANCKKEMLCIRNGVTAVWNISHCYTGDLYKCPSCGVEVLPCTSSPYYDPKALGGDEKYTIDMSAND